MRHTKHGRGHLCMFNVCPRAAAPGPTNDVAEAELRAFVLHAHVSTGFLCGRSRAVSVFPHNVAIIQEHDIGVFCAVALRMQGGWACVLVPCLRFLPCPWEVMKCQSPLSSLSHHPPGPPNDDARGRIHHTYLHEIPVTCMCMFAACS